MSNQTAAESALDALGDRQRRQIIQQLRHGPLTVGKLAEQLTIGRPAVSKHLRVLQGAGLISHQSVGTRNRYALAPEALVPLQQWLIQNWTGTLSPRSFEVFTGEIGAWRPLERHSVRGPAGTVAFENAPDRDLRRRKDFRWGEILA
jgi:DNA-binding transcriptional ArsR family regulator